MKKILFTISLLLATYLANAQGYRLYIDDNGKSTDVFKATSYVVVKQLADTAWLMQQYDMENAILQSGNFKDRNLQVSNGKFVYYRKLNFYNNKQMKEWLKSDTANCIMTEGQFKDGKKDGEWNDYFIGGKKQEVVHYKNGVLNGTYRKYGVDGNAIALSGNYVDGKREGDWQMFDLEGKVMRTDKYRDGKLYKTKMTLGPYNLPKPPNGFENYVMSELRKAASSQLLQSTAIDYTIIFAVTTEGKVIDPSLVLKGHEDDPLARILIGIVKNSPQWTPGNTGDENKPVEDITMVSVEINKGIITTKVLDHSKATAAYFNSTR